MEACAVAHTGALTPIHWASSWTTSGGTLRRTQARGARPFSSLPTFCAGTPLYSRTSFLGQCQKQQDERRTCEHPTWAVRCQAVEHAQMSKVFRQTKPVGGAVQTGGQGTVAIKGSRSAQERVKTEADAVNEEVRSPCGIEASLAARLMAVGHRFFFDPVGVVALA